MEAPVKRKFLSSYLEAFGYTHMPVSAVTEVLYEADKDGVTELFLTNEQYEAVRRLMVHSAMWNWDKNTFLGIKLTKV